MHSWYLQEGNDIHGDGKIMCIGLHMHVMVKSEQKTYIYSCICDSLKTQTLIDVFPARKPNK